MNSLMVVHVIL